MPAINRINLLSMFCSCVAHAAILGGCLLAGYRAPHVATVRTQQVTTMAVSFAPARRVTPPQPDAPPTRPVGTPIGTVSPGPRHPEAWTAAPDAVIVPVGAVTAMPVPVAATTAPPVSDGAPSRDALASYQRQLYETIARNSRYPAAARRLHLSGVTQLAFRLDRAGTVLDSWIQESSGSDLLDTAATDALARAHPLPPIPAALPARMDFVIELDSSVIQQVATGSAR